MLLLPHPANSEIALYGLEQIEQLLPKAWGPSSSRCEQEAGLYTVHG